MRSSAPEGEPCISLQRFWLGSTFRRHVMRAVASDVRDGEVRFVGEVDSSVESMRRLIKRLKAKLAQVHFCDQAGPTGYGLHRLIVSVGFPCSVVAPPLIPRKARRSSQDQPSCRGMPPRANLTHEETDVGTLLVRVFEGWGRQRSHLLGDDPRKAKIAAALVMADIIPCDDKRSACRLPTRLATGWDLGRVVPPGRE